MRISVEVGHPAHVHYWRNAIRLFEQHGHEVVVFAREKEITVELLRAYGLDFRIVGRSRRGVARKFLGIARDDLQVLRAAKENSVEFMLSTGIPGSAHASRMLGVPHLALIDTEVAVWGRLLTEPFSDVVCTPACFKARVMGPRHIPLQGYFELMYLHPKYFTPDPSVLSHVGVEPGDAYVVMRLSSADSSHDIGVRTDSLSRRLNLVRRLAKDHRIFISSEVPLPREFDPFLLDIPPQHFHDLLSYATAYVGDGAKTAAEAGVLGVPWVYTSSSPRGYLTDLQDRFSLGRCVASIADVEPLLASWREQVNAGDWHRRRERLLRETEDLTGIIVKIVEHWPNYPLHPGNGA